MESARPAVSASKPAVGDMAADNSSCLVITELVLRVCVGVVTVISLSLMGSTRGFDKVPAFSYMLAAAVLSFLYSAAQIVFVAIHLGRCCPMLRANAFYIYFTVSADLVCCLLLISGTSATFGLTTNINSSSNLISQVNASASLGLIAFAVMVPVVALSDRRLYRPT